MPNESNCAWRAQAPAVIVEYIKLRISVLLGVLFAFAAAAQTVTNVVDQFDPAGIGGNSYSAGQITNVWGNWFGNAFQSLAWDGASDANGNPNSGSLKILANFDGSGSIPNQFEVYNGFNSINPPLNGTQYTNFQCDVRFAAGSAVAVFGTSNFGRLEFGIATAGYGQDYFGGVTVPASNTNWVHVSLPINAGADTNLLSIGNILIHIYGPYYGSPGLSGTSVLWVDNIKFVGSPPPPNVCVVDRTNVHQRIDGFGASSAWNGTWTAAQADMFFSSNTGIGLSLLRSRIGPDGSTYETSIMQMAQARGAKVWSTPWSPPAIYKSTNSVNGGSFVSSPANYHGYASQLAAYVASMKTNYGVNLYAVSIQNEPDESTTYESCLWTAQQFHDFVPYLAAALSNAGVASTRIMLTEDAVWDADFGLATTTMADPNTAAQVGILAAHDYGGSDTPVTNYGKPLWETEVSTFDAFDGSISNGLYWAGQIHNLLTIDQVNAWHFWWLIPFNSDNEGLTDTSGNPAKRMYVLGNYSRFVRPNFYRIGAANNSPALISAYKDTNSSSFVIVAANPTTNIVNQNFILTNFPATGALTQWITSATLSLSNQGSVYLTNNSFNYALPPWSVVTFISGPSPNLAWSLTGTNVTLAWPAACLGWTLQAQTNALAVGHWVDIANSPGTNQMTLPVNRGNGAVFYRLRQ